jgi:transposase
MFVHVLDADGKTVFEKDLPADPAAFLDAIEPYRSDLVVGCECMFAWYWLADLCADESIPFALGHALYMRMIHGGKTKTDRIDAGKLASLLRGGLFPLAYAYPKAKRQTRDLLRRRSFFVRQRSQLLTHIVNTNTQFNLPPLTKKLTYAANRPPELLDRFTDPSTKRMVAADLALIDAYDERIAELERYLVPHAKVDDPVTFGLLRTVPGIGQVLGLRCCTRSTTSNASRSRGTSCRMPGWSAARTRAPARRRAPAGRRSATPTSSGPSPRPPAFCSEPARRPRRGCSGGRRRRGRRRPCRSWRPSSAARCTTCGASRSRST